MPKKLKQLLFNILFYICLISLAIYLVIYGLTKNKSVTSVINYDFTTEVKHNDQPENIDPVFEIPNIQHDSIIIPKYTKDPLIQPSKKEIQHTEIIKQVVIDTPNIEPIKEEVVQIQKIDTNKTSKQLDSVQIPSKKSKKKWLFFTIKE